MEQALSAAKPPPLQSYLTLSCDTSMIMRADRYGAERWPSPMVWNASICCSLT
jgi:hypothetical protein